jgi:hypothetical protein
MSTRYSNPVFRTNTFSTPRTPGAAYQWDDVNAASTPTGAAQVALKKPSKHSDPGDLFSTAQQNQAALFASPAFQAGSFSTGAAVIVAPPPAVFFYGKPEYAYPRRTAVAPTNQSGGRRRVGGRSDRRRSHDGRAGHASSLQYADDLVRRSAVRAASEGSGRPNEGGSVNAPVGPMAGAASRPRRPAGRPERDARREGAEPTEAFHGERAAAGVRLRLRGPNPRRSSAPSTRSSESLTFCLQARSASEGFD